MNDNRTGGALLVAGCVAGLITMSLHPVAPRGGTLPSPHALAALATLDRAVHGLALTGVVMMFLGAMVLPQRLVAQNRRASVALVVFGFAAIAIMIAGAMSGFVGADILSKMVEGDPKLESRRMMLDYTFRINQAFAGIYTVGTCAAIFLWSLELLRTRLARVLGWYGLLLAPWIILALFTGNLPLDVHGMGLVVLTQSIWFIVAGSLLMRDTGTKNHQEHSAGLGAGEILADNAK